MSSGNDNPYGDPDAGEGNPYGDNPYGDADADAAAGAGNPYGDADADAAAADEIESGQQGQEAAAAQQPDGSSGGPGAAEPPGPVAADGDANLNPYADAPSGNGEANPYAPSAAMGGHPGATPVGSPVNPYAAANDNMNIPPPPGPGAGGAVGSREQVYIDSAMPPSGGSNMMNQSVLNLSQHGVPPPGEPQSGSLLQNANDDSLRQEHGSSLLPGASNQDPAGQLHLPSSAPPRPADASVQLDEEELISLKRPKPGGDAFQYQVRKQEALRKKEEAKGKADAYEFPEVLLEGENGPRATEAIFGGRDQNLDGGAMEIDEEKSALEQVEKLRRFKNLVTNERHAPEVVHMGVVGEEFLAEIADHLDMAGPDAGPTILEIQQEILKVDFADIKPPEFKPQVGGGQLYKESGKTQPTEAYLLKKEAEQILLLDLQHLRYLVKDFVYEGTRCTCGTYPLTILSRHIVRLRLRKIEEYPQYYATVAGARAMLTSKEQKVAEKLWELERKNFQERCLDKLARRAWVQNLTKAEARGTLALMGRPKLHLPVFCQVVDPAGLTVNMTNVVQRANSAAVSGGGGSSSLTGSGSTPSPPNANSGPGSFGGGAAGGSRGKTGSSDGNNNPGNSSDPTTTSSRGGSDGRGSFEFMAGGGMAGGGRGSSTGGAQNTSYASGLAGTDRLSSGGSSSAGGSDVLKQLAPGGRYLLSYALVRDAIHQEKVRLV
eukprot:g13620.t1